MTQKKGLIAYDTRYGSTAEVAYWLRALIGEDQAVEVKKLEQILTVKPYDYVIIGSYTRWEKSFKPTYAFISKFYNDLAQKQVAYFITSGECDETTVMKMPGKPPHLSCGRNYLFDQLENFPAIKPVTTGGFGGRQTTPLLNRKDSFLIWLLGKTMPKDKIGWDGRDVWESLIPERVEAFANEIRQKIVSLPPRNDAAAYRTYWTSLQPANLADPAKAKNTVKPYTLKQDTSRVLLSRFRIRGTLDDAVSHIHDWSRQTGATLNVKKRDYYILYYQAVKNYNGKNRVIHIVAALFPEDPGNVQIALRNYDRPDHRKGVSEDMTKAEEFLCANGRGLK